MKARNWTFVLFVALAACSDPVADSARQVDTARQYIEQNKVWPAALELKNALRSNADNAEARYMLGELNLLVGEYQAAEKEFRRAREAGWKPDESLVMAVDALISGRDYKRATTLLDQARANSKAIESDHAALRGLALLGQGKTGDAEQQLAAAQKLDRNRYQVIRLHSSLLLSSADYETVYQTVHAAPDKIRTKPGLLVLAAQSSLQLNQYERARADYQIILDAEPKKIVTAFGRNARLGMTQVHIKQRNFDQAKAVLQPLYERHGKDPLLNYFSGMLAIANEDYDKANDYLLKVLNLAPDHAPTQLLYGLTSFSQQNYEQAAYYLSRYIDSAPGNTAARKLLGRTYILLGQDKEASDILSEVSNSEDSELLAMIGYSAIRSGDFKSGITSLQKSVQSSPDDPRARSELAKAYIRAGETQQAIEELNKLVELEGATTRTDALLIIAYLQEKQNQQAIDVAMTAVSRSSHDPAVLAMVANVFIAVGDSSEAELYLKKALKQQSDFVPAAMSLGRLYEQLDQMSAAIDVYKTVSDLGARSVEPLMARARIAESEGDTNTMVAMLRKASEVAPGDLRATMLLGQHFMRAGEFDEADKVISIAEKKASSSSVVLSMRARLLMATGKFNEALAPLNDLILRSPESRHYRSMLAEVYWRLGQLDDAERQLELVLKDRSYYKPALILMVRVNQARGDLAKARQYVDQIINMSPDHYVGYELLGDLFYMQKRYKDSIQNYRLAQNLNALATTAVKMAKAASDSGNEEQAISILAEWDQRIEDNVIIKQQLGASQINVGKLKDAIKTFEAVLKLDSDNVIAHNNLGWLFTESRLDKARGHAERAYELEPENPGVLDTYGWILVQSGKVDEGKRLLDKAHAMVPSSAEIMHHYGVSLIKGNESVEGKRMLMRLLEKYPGYKDRDAVESAIKG